MTLATRRARRRISLRVRLLAVLALLTTATVLVVTGLTAALARGHLERALDRRLEDVAQSFRRGPAQQLGTSRLEASVRTWLASYPLGEGEMAAIRLPSGVVLTSAGGRDVYEVPERGVLLASRQARWWNLHGDDGGVRGLTVPLRAGGRQAGTLVLLAYTETIASTLSALLSGIGLATLIGVAFAALLGAWLVRRSLRPLHDMTREVEAIGAASDLTRRIGPRGSDEVGRLATQFDRMLERLQEAFDSQRRFLADASHELRTPLTVARGELELAAERLSRRVDRRSLGLATGELDRMARIVDDLLLLARLDEGIPLASEPVEVELVLRDALLRGMLADQRPASVEVDRVVYAQADAERLLQVVTNLVRNAVEHGDEDTKLTLSARAAGERAEIVVADTGPGIPPQELPHVFDRLFRGGRARAVAPAGAGLGLPIAASLVRAMNGTIDVRSDAGRGTSVTVSLPLAATPVDAVAADRTAVQQPPDLRVVGA